MRTTVDIEEDVLRVAKSLASERGKSLGRILSELARRGLEPRNEPRKFRNRVPLLPRRPGGEPVTSEHVKELLESHE